MATATHARFRHARTHRGRAALRRVLLPLLATALAVGLSTGLASASSPTSKTQRVQKIDRVISVARALKGTPYVWGGTGRRGFDCSGYTRFVFAKVGEALPRTSGQQYASVKKVARSAVRRGDLIFFRSQARIYHVGIYAGSQRIWHSPRPGAAVRLERIWASTWRAGRVLT